MTEAYGPPLPDPAATARAYHLRTKHHLDRYAAGPGTLDWDAQPDPFRQWPEAAEIPLPRRAGELATAWDALAEPRPTVPFSRDSLGDLLQLCVAITAWKGYGTTRWSLRAHPSSGNLHPTETYLIARGVADLADGLYHYQPRDHALELRAGGEAAPGGPAAFLGFTSIHWREAWKYGERAFRYCQLDMGHVLAAVAYASALFGWRPRLVALPAKRLAALLGTDRAADFQGVEAEEAEVLLALHHDAGEPLSEPPAWSEWHGHASLLDPRHLYQWPVIEEVAEATRGVLPLLPEVSEHQPVPLPSPLPLAGEGAKPLAARVILQRRSAQAFDGESLMPRAVFRRLLAGLMPGGSPVWELWPHAPRVHPVLLVHRVEGVAPGVYCLARTPAARTALARAMRESFEWTAVDPELPLYRLVAARAGKAARTLSCHQDIAFHGALACMMVAEFAGPITANPAAYRHLHWEAGMLGHVLGLEAEAAGWRGTGIGCFFDDAGHEILGLADETFQVIYHFAVGMPVDDSRLTTAPAYD